MKKIKILVFVAVVFAVFGISRQAHAAGAGGTGFEYVYFRIDTEIDNLNDQGVSIRFRCDGTGEGILTDGTASESTNSQDGIIKLASRSAEFGSAEAGCDAGETITATVSLGGWLSRTWSGTVAASTSNGEANPFTTRASMDYTITVNGVADELGTAITLDGSTASATYSGTVASQSYRSGKKYIAGSTSGGTVKGGANNYVNVTSSAMTVSATASQSVDFGTSDSSSVNATGLPFGVKVLLNGTTRTGSVHSNITGATVKAGDSVGTSCTDSSGVYYCPIPITHTGVTATGTSIPYGMLTASCTYDDRTSNADTQSTCTINAVEASVVGGGGGGGSTPPTDTPTPTPEATPTPSPTASGSPTPLPLATPTPTSRSSIPDATVDPTQVSLHEGEVIGASSDGDPDVYIVNVWGYKRLFLNPVIFGFYGHLGGFVKVVKIALSTRDVLPTSGLFRNCEVENAKVWAVEITGEDTGTLHHVDMSGESAVAQDPNFFKKVFCINTNEETWYSKSTDAYTSLSQIPSYSRR